MFIRSLVLMKDHKMAVNDSSVVCRSSFKQMMLSRSGSSVQN